MAKYYAWSNITTGDVTVNVGEEVDQGTINVDDSTWQQMIDNGVVRESKFPDTSDAPNDYFRGLLGQVQSGELSPDEYQKIMSESGGEASTAEPTVTQNPPDATADTTTKASTSSK
jgi:hypothetical protein